LVGVVLSSPDAQEAFEVAQAMARNCQPLTDIGAQIFGPAPAPIARIRGRHRVRLLVKAEKNAPIQAALSTWTALFKLPNSLRLSIDIDPQSFY
jgi:primosomal protein N' (replication factor Y)